MKSVETKRDALHRLACIEGHLQAVHRMVEQDQACVDVLRQSYAIRRAVVKLGAVVLRGHLDSVLSHTGRPEEIYSITRDRPGCGGIRHRRGLSRQAAK